MKWNRIDKAQLVKTLGMIAAVVGPLLTALGEHIQTEQIVKEEVDKRMSELESKENRA